MAVRIGINGFGRIGRLVYRIAAERGLEIAAVNDIVPADNLAYLLSYDTMQGGFRLEGSRAQVEVTDAGFAVNGRETQALAIKDPAELPWKRLAVDYVLESTGLFTDHVHAGGHIKAGAQRVVISAPTKSSPDEVPTICLGVNDDLYDPARHTIISNASCTTNCLAPVAKVIHDSVGLAEGLMTTVHAVTATQPTQDGPSKKDWRGGRNAYLNIIPSSTGAAKAVALCIPALKGRLTGMAFRVPTATVSVIDLTFRSERDTALADINSAMQRAAEGEHARHTRLQRRCGRFERLRRRPPQQHLRRRRGHRAQPPLLQGGELVRQRGRLCHALCRSHRADGPPRRTRIEYHAVAIGLADARLADADGAMAAYGPECASDRPRSPPCSP